MVLTVNEFYKRQLTKDELKQRDKEVKEFAKSLLEDEMESLDGNVEKPKELSYAIETLELAKYDYEERMQLMDCRKSRYKRFESRVKELHNAIVILKQHTSKRDPYQDWYIR